MQARVVQAYCQAPKHWLADGGYVSASGIYAVAEGSSQLVAPIDARMKPERDSAAVAAWRARMESEAGKQLYGLRGRTIEWVNAGARRRGLYHVAVRGLAKSRAVALCQGLAHDVSCILHRPVLRAAALSYAAPACVG
jgi:hypothetical protein